MVSQKSTQILNHATGSPGQAHNGGHLPNEVKESHEVRGKNCPAERPNVTKINSIALPEKTVFGSGNNPASGVPENGLPGPGWYNGGF